MPTPGRDGAARDRAAPPRGPARPRRGACAPRRSRGIPREPQEVASEHAIEVARGKACALHLAQDRAVIVSAVLSRVAVRPIRPVQAPARTERAERLVAE